MKSILRSGMKLLYCALFICLNSNPISAKEGCDLILNGDFSNGRQEWIASLNKDKGVVGSDTFKYKNASFYIDSIGTKAHFISLEQRGVRIEDGESYQIRFEAKAEMKRPITVSVSDIGNKFLTLGRSNKDFELTKEWTVYEYSFNADTTDNTTRLIFMLGASTADVFIDNVSMKKLNCKNCMPAGTSCDDKDACTINDKEDGACNCAGELSTDNQIINGDFSDKLSPWHSTIINRNTNPENLSKLNINNKEAHFEIRQAGTEKWLISLVQQNLFIEANQHYKLNFKAKASEAREINIEITSMSDTYATLFSKDVELTDSFKYYTFNYGPTFTEEEVRIIFYMGLDTPDVIIDDVVFEKYNCEPCEEYKEVCDDGDPCTIDDFYDASCNCVSYIEQEQYVNNGTFSNQFSGWMETLFADSGVIAETNFEDKLAHFKIEKDGTRNWHISLEQRGIPFVADQEYAISFRAKAAIGRKMNIKISDYPNASHTYFDKYLVLKEEWQAYKYTYRPDSTDDFTRIIFNMGVDELNIGPNEIFIDDVSIAITGCEDYIPVNPQDSLVLLQFYEQSCKIDCNLNWNLSRPAHTWEGVEIENGDLISLNLVSKGLSGSIPFMNLPALRELDLSDNNFSGEVADFSKLQMLNKLDISKNRFNFNAIVENLDINAFIDNFIYSPQYIGNDETYILNKGDDKTLQLVNKLIVNDRNFSFQWKQNNREIASATNPDYILTNMNVDAIGSYTLHITNESLVSGLEVILKPQNVLISGYDINGQKIYNNEIMVLFDNFEDRDLFAEKYLNPPYSGKVSFQCDCNRLLYLYKFQSSDAAAEILLDIDKRRQAITPKGVPLGNPNQTYKGDVNSFENATDNLESWKWPKSDNINDTVNVYLLDTGLDINNFTNANFLMEEAPKSCFDETVAAGYSYVTSQNKISAYFEDANGHGTYGYNAITRQRSDDSKLKIVPIKLFGENGEGSMFHFVCGLFHSIDNNADIINVSAGFKGGNSSILESALQLAQQKGIFITAAAGNDGVNLDSIPQYPAHYAGQFYQKQRFDSTGIPSLDENNNPIFDSIPYDNIISIAALNDRNELADFSNFSAQSVTLSAYGENLISYGLDNEEVIWSGTSMATFFTTRELASEISKDKSRTYEQIWNDFEENYLIAHKNTDGKTITGKQIDVTLEPGFNAKIGKIEQMHNIINTFPNPSNGKINVLVDCDYEFLNYSDIQIRLFDIIGNEKITLKVACGTPFQFDLSGFAKGTYLIMATNYAKNYYSKFIVE